MQSYEIKTICSPSKTTANKGNTWITQASRSITKDLLTRTSHLLDCLWCNGVDATLRSLNGFRSGKRADKLIASRPLSSRISRHTPATWGQAPAWTRWVRCDSKALDLSLVTTAAMEVCLLLGALEQASQEQLRWMVQVEEWWPGCLVWICSHLWRPRGESDCSDVLTNAGPPPALHLPPPLCGCWSSV